MADVKKNRISVLFSDLTKPLLRKKPIINTSQNKEVFAEFLGSGGGWKNLFTFTFTGEKNIGELGQLKNYLVEYDILRIRSWQSYLESEVTLTVFGRLVRWVIGSGLKLQSEPLVEVLKQEGIKVDKAFAQSFSRSVEARFRIYKHSKNTDHSKVVSLDKIASRAYKNAIVGGDVLVVLRYENGEITIQLIDGAHVQSPFFGTETYPYVTETGTRIMYGVEIDDNRTPVAYHVRQWQDPNQIYKYTRIPAKDPLTGLTMAFMVYGLEYRVDSIRGLPLVAAVLETLKKMERYKEATLSSAEERAKVPYTIEHGVASSGENPLVSQMLKAHDVGNPLNEQLPKDVSMKDVQNTFVATMGKQLINMPVDSKLASLESKNDLYFKDFYTINIDSICSTLNIPPDVAKSMYNSNFSASRAALKDWEHTLHVNRKDFAEQFYKPIYKAWMYVQILKNKFSAPGFLTAMYSQNDYIIESYLMSRWIGTPVPHIDPVKEVSAERLKLGKGADNIPLTTVESATEHLNSGESVSNMEQFAEEKELAEELGIISELQESTEDTTNTEENAE